MTSDPAYVPGMPEWVTRRAALREQVEGEGILARLDALESSSAGLSMAGAWTAKGYAAKEMVRHNDSLWVATRAALSTDVPALSTVTNVGSVVPVKIDGTGAGNAKPYSVSQYSSAQDDAFYYDVATAGSLTLVTTATDGTPYVRALEKNATTVIVQGSNSQSFSVPTPGRYYVLVMGAANTPSGTISITPGTAVIGSPSPWELVVKGVA